MGIDIHDYFRGARKWTEFHRLIRRLPRHSHFYASLLDNEEDAAALLADGEPSSFGMRDWTHERDLLSTLIDEVRLMHATLYSSHGGKNFPFKPMPRPVTALQRVDRRQKLDRHRERVRLVIPEST